MPIVRQHENQDVLCNNTKKETIENIYRGSVEERWINEGNWFEKVREFVLNHSYSETKNKSIPIVQNRYTSLLSQHNKFIVKPETIARFYLHEFFEKSPKDPTNKGTFGTVALDKDMTKLFERLESLIGEEDKILFGMIYVAESGFDADFNKFLSDKGALQVGTETSMSVSTSANNYKRIFRRRVSEGSALLVKNKCIHFACNNAKKHDFTAQWLATKNNLFTYSVFTPIKENEYSFTLTAFSFPDLTTISKCFQSSDNPTIKEFKVLFILGNESKELDRKFCHAARKLKNNYGSTFNVHIKSSTIIYDDEQMHDFDRILGLIERRNYKATTDETLRCNFEEPKSTQKREPLNKTYHFYVAPCGHVETDQQFIATSVTFPTISMKDNVEVLSHDCSYNLLDFTEQIINLIMEDLQPNAKLPKKVDKSAYQRETRSKRRRESSQGSYDNRNTRVTSLSKNIASPNDTLEDTAEDAQTSKSAPVFAHRQNLGQSTLKPNSQQNWGNSPTAHWLDKIKQGSAGNGTESPPTSSNIQEIMDYVKTHPIGKKDTSTSTFGASQLQQSTGHFLRPRERQQTLESNYSCPPINPVNAGVTSGFPRLSIGNSPSLSRIDNREASNAGQTPRYSDLQSVHRGRSASRSNANNARNSSEVKLPRI